MKKINWWVIGTGVAVGIAALILTACGNPANMGFCIACFLRDTAGALGLHSAGKVQYIRPEIIGLVLGALIMTLAAREFKVKAGSSPATRFVLGIFVMIGALAFLGCPLRLVLRLGGGDLTAVAGLAGFVLGIGIGSLWLKKGFSLGRAYEVRKAEGFVLPAIMVVLLVALIAAPAFIHFSQEGPGAKHAAVGIALVVALVVGALCQKSRLCMAGGIRDAFLMKDFTLLSGFLAIWVTVTIGNLILGNYHLGVNTAEFIQAISHNDYLWSCLGMVLVGWGSVMLGGCPLRQLILAGSGNVDAGLTVIGMIVGAAFAHNFGLAGNAASVADGVLNPGGVSTAGKVAVIVGFVVCLIVALTHMPKKEVQS
ncbi:MAG: YedE-related selenium metabolism membrane protein [Clostridiales bacterium]|nr:YedE-related selenium metabolism membrane protein [Clostridiales bacterium]